MTKKKELGIYQEVREKVYSTGAIERPWIYLGILVVLSLAMNLYEIDWGLPVRAGADAELSANEFDWAPDSLAPVKPLAYAKRLIFRETWQNKYPPFHFLLLALAYSPYVLFLALTGGLTSVGESFPYGLRNPDFSLTMFTLIARSVSVLMSTGLVFVNYVTVKKFFDYKAAFISSFLIMSSYPIIHYSHNANLDIPQLFWMALAVYSLVNILESYKLKYYIALGIFTALAVCTKESIYAFFVGVIPPLLYYHIKNQAGVGIEKRIRMILLERKLLWGFLSFCIVVIIMFNPILNWDGVVYHFELQSLKALRGNIEIRESSSLLNGDLKLIGEYAKYIYQSNGGVVFVVCLSGILYCLAKYPNKVWIFTLSMIIYYMLFLRLHGTHHLRYILPIFIILTWYGGKFLADIIESRYLPKYLSNVAIIIILGYSLIYGFSLNILYAHDPRYELEKWIDENIPRNTLILAVKPGYSLPRFPREQMVKYRDLWDYNGEQIADIVDLDPAYIVISMSIQRREEDRAEVEAFFADRGYQMVRTFKNRVPIYGVEIDDLRSVNPEIAVLRKSATVQGQGESFLQEQRSVR